MAENVFKGRIQIDPGNTQAAFNGVAVSATKASEQLKKLPATSNAATQSLVDLSRVAQDAPFGFLGIANNLNPLLESFQRLKASTGTTAGAFKALGQSLTGAGGIGLALGVVSSLLVVFGDKLFGAGKAAKETEDMYAGLGKALADQAVKLTSLVGIVKNVNSSYDDKQKALRAINQEYGSYLTNLGSEEVTLGNINTAYELIIQNLLKQAVVKGIQEEITKEVQKTAASLIALHKSIKEGEVATERYGKKANQADTAIRQLNRATTDGYLANVQRTQAMGKAIAKEDVASLRIQELTQQLIKQLAPLLDITAEFDDLGIKLDKIKDKKIEFKLIPKSTVDFSTFNDSIASAFEANLKKNGGFKFNVDTGLLEFVERDLTAVEKLFEKTQSKLKGLKPLDLSGLNKGFEEASKQMKEFTADSINAATLIADVLGGAFLNMFDAIVQGGNAMKGFFEGLKNSISQLISKLIQAAILAALISAIPGGGSFGAIFGKLIGFSGGGRAGGGRVSRGVPYMVGEVGREMFIPDTGGTIVPNNKLGVGISGGGNNINISGEFVQRGNDLVAVITRVNQSQRRLT